jgi:hypothetical protein
MSAYYYYYYYYYYYGLDNVGFESRQGQEIFIFSETFRPALDLTQSCAECVTGKRDKAAGA